MPRAIADALELATTVGASVYVLYVASLDEASNVGIERIEQGLLYTDLEGIREELTESILAPPNERTVPITRDVMVGRPDKQILKYIATETPDLAIMGSQEKIGVDRLILGSVAENVARRSVVSVQLVSRLINRSRNTLLTRSRPYYRRKPPVLISRSSIPSA